MRSPGRLLLLLLCLIQSSFAAEKLPNFVVILADDLGYGDLGCYGHPTIRTPNLDRMAAEGMKLTDFYVAACVCTPSRAALLTGRLPIRSGMAGTEKRRVLYPDNTGGLPASEITIARALKAKDYATACIGKWHLGHQKPNLPTSHGFDEFFGLPYSNDMDRIPAAKKADTGSMKPRYADFNVPLMRNEEILERPAVQTTLTARYTEEAQRFIRKNKTRSFFLYLPHTFPHVPLFASQSFSGQSRRGLYGDVVEELDWGIGQVLETLRSEGLAENTLVIFTSDNGPWLVRNQAGGSAGLLRDGKGSTWEGGMRVPCIAWWPGKIKPASVKSDQAGTMDILPTLLTLAKLPLPADRPLDGFDMSPILFDSGAGRRDVTLYYRGDELYAVRKGMYKAAFTTRDGYTKEPLQKHDPPLLFHLGIDPSEKFNIGAEHPEIVKELLAEAEKHRATCKPAEAQY